ncbi:MAG TPA: SDR family oxidoreductase [Bryobacteraceae bacterium]|nr:SDR family oxidoreductase [Bryobacteraceae bacterium]
MRKVIVTGGAGFIGSALVRALVARGDSRIHVVDNFLTGSEQNLAEVSSEIELHRTDIRNYDQLVPVFDGADTVFHLAAIPSVPRSIRQPVTSHEVNIDGTFNVYRAAAETRVRRVIYAASSSAYGDTQVLPKTETMLPNPRSPYAAQKLMGEYYASVFKLSFGLETVSLRFFNVYGERQDPSSPYSGVISLFLTAILDRRPPTIFGDGQQSRDFTYVEDVIALVLKAADASRLTRTCYNAGNGGRYTLNEVWQYLQRLEGVDIVPLYGPPREGDVRDSQADTTAARTDLGHSPNYTLEEGLRRTLIWYRTMHVRGVPEPAKIDGPIAASPR